ncbi:MAG: hypothetical protein J6P00_07110, partial [Acetobacter sp.]|nr:hypothetical protein [Acetobacter sp.]
MKLVALLLVFLLFDSGFFLVYSVHASSQKIGHEASCYSLVALVSLQDENGFLVVPVAING